MPKPPSIYQIVSDPEGNPAFVMVPYSSCQIISDVNGKPAFVVIPCDHMPPMRPVDEEESTVSGMELLHKYLEKTKPPEPIPRILDGDDNDLPYPTKEEINSAVKEGAQQFMKHGLSKSFATYTVKEWREHFSMTEDQMARKLKIPLVAYRNIERSLQPHENSLKKVADALGIQRKQIKV